jgi:hypothetical protein
MKLKRQSEFTEKQRIHFVCELWNDITFNGKELRLEVTSSDEPIAEGGENTFYSQTCIWDMNGLEPKLVYHTLYKQTLPESICLEICNNIGEDPAKFIK